MNVGGNLGAGAMNPGNTLCANNSLFNSSNSSKLDHLSAAINDITLERKSFCVIGCKSISSSDESLSEPTTEKERPGP